MLFRSAGGEVERWREERDKEWERVERWREERDKEWERWRKTEEGREGGGRGSDGSTLHPRVRKKELERGPEREKRASRVREGTRNERDRQRKVGQRLASKDSKD